jgi:hypothetical protein
MRKSVLIEFVEEKIFENNYEKYLKIYEEKEKDFKNNSDLYCLKYIQL